MPNTEGTKGKKTAREGPAAESKFPVIQGVDTAKGIAATGGTTESYRQVLAMFRKDVKSRLQLLRLYLFESMSQSIFPQKHLPAFITQILAIKSAAASLGAAEIPEEAARLEEAGKTGGLAYIQENLGGFIDRLSSLVKNIDEVLDGRETKGQKNPHSAARISVSEFISLLSGLSNALKTKNLPKIDTYLEELNKITLDSKTKEISEQISDLVLMAEFDSAIMTIDKLVNNGIK